MKRQGSLLKHGGSSSVTPNQNNIMKDIDDTRSILRNLAYKSQINSTNSRHLDGRRNEFLRDFGAGKTTNPNQAADFRLPITPVQPAEMAAPNNFTAQAQKCI